jgi:hypothetical protein
MKKIFLAFVFVSTLFISLQAQTEKGDWMVGGRIDLNTGDNSTQIGFTPAVGYFVINNLAIGGNVLIDYNKSADIKVTNLGIGPFVRYYFTESKIRPLLQVAVNFINTKIKSPLGSESNTGTNLFLGGGAAIFINPNVSLEPIIGYSNTKYKNFEGSGAFSFGFGFQVYINKGQVDRLKGNQ